MKTIEPPARLEVAQVDDVGTSRNLITYSPINKLLPSVHAVISNDDLLIEILLRLPITLLYMVKPVSKRWLSLITDTKFLKRRRKVPKVDSPCGLFIRRPAERFIGYDFVPFDVKVSASIQSFTEADKKLFIIQSCNGLLLCYKKPDEFYVYNPCLNVFKVLPDSSNSLRDPSFAFGGVRIAFDPTKSLHYKIIHAAWIQDDANEVGYSIQIETYSSETCNWSVGGDPFPFDIFGGFLDGIYWNGAIHWLNFGDDQHLHYKLDIEKHPILRNVLIPLTADGKVHCGLKLFESRGFLLLLCRDHINSQHLKIYEMRNGYSEWSMKLLVNLDEILMPFFRTRGMPIKWGVSSVLSIVLEETEEDSFMVIKVDATVLQYKFVSETICMLCDSASSSFPITFQFIASFAGV